MNLSINDKLSQKSKTVSMKTFVESSENELEKVNLTNAKDVFRKFWEARKPECKVGKENFNYDILPFKTLLSGSKYEGSWEGPWMTGYGAYVFPNGVEYEGDIKDGVFHGQGDLRYPNGTKLRGMWNKGICSDRTVIFSDNLQYEQKDWKYCKDPDRRYRIEYEKMLQPGGASFITATQPSRDIPPGYYDTGDGFYNPKTFVYKNFKMNQLSRVPDHRERKWIELNCRRDKIESIGPMPDLYPEWSVPNVKLKEPPPQPAKTISDTSLFKCLSLFDDDVNYMVSFLNMGGSSSSSSSSES